MSFELDDMDDTDEMHFDELQHEGLDVGPVCRGCGCSAFDPCPGGCVWATADLCSQCVRQELE